MAIAIIGIYVLAFTGNGGGCFDIRNG